MGPSAGTPAEPFPELDAQALEHTRPALHAYAKVLGAIREALSPPQKHYWHLNLRPWLSGFETGPVYAARGAFNLVLNLRDSRVEAVTAAGKACNIPLVGQCAAELAGNLHDFLAAERIAIPRNAKLTPDETRWPDYSASAAARIALAFRLVAARLVALRHAQRKETGPVRLWPHHFDLAMLWFSGRLVKGRDPAEADQADEQVNIGFTLGDSVISEPYFYVTAYPLDGLWRDQGFAPPVELYDEAWTGLIIRYRKLLAMRDPGDVLSGTWHSALAIAAAATAHGDTVAGNR